MIFRIVNAMLKIVDRIGRNKGDYEWLVSDEWMQLHVKRFRKEANREYTKGHWKS